MSSNSERLQSLYNSLSGIAGLTTYIAPFEQFEKQTLPCVELRVDNESNILQYANGSSETIQIYAIITLIVETSKTSDSTRLTAEKTKLDLIDSILSSTGIKQDGDIKNGFGILSKGKKYITISMIKGLY